MQWNFPPNLIYMLFCFLLMDFVNQTQFMTFPTLAATINIMNNHTLLTHFGITPTEESLSIANTFITSSATVGMVLALFTLVPCADTKGRKFTAVYLRSILAIVSSMCHLTSSVFQATEFFVLGQILLGASLPLRMFVTTLFITEVSPDKYRGFASTALIFSDVIGQAVMYSVGSPNILGNADTWFIFPLMAIVSSFVIFCLAVRLPESPKWLVRQNKMNEAARSAEYYHGENCDLKELMTSFIREKNLTAEDKLSIRQVFQNDTMREGMKILFALTTFLMFDYLSIQSSYTVLLNQKAGFSVQDAMNINFIFTIAFFPTRFIGTYIIDALGRRPVFVIAGLIIYAKNITMLATQTIIYIAGSSSLTRVMFIAVQFLTDCIPATGVASLGVLFVTELFPPSARTSVAQAMILGTLVVSFPIGTIFPIAYSFFAPAFFVPPIFVQFFLGLFLFKHMPETRARAICDIIEAMDQDVASRSASILEEKTPLIRDRARTFAIKRNSILLNTPRTRALTVDHNLFPNKLSC